MAALVESETWVGAGHGLDRFAVLTLGAGTDSTALAAHRHPAARPLDLETKVSDFHGWARGAAVLAIQVLVLGGGTAGESRRRKALAGPGRDGRPCSA